SGCPVLPTHLDVPGDRAGEEEALLRQIAEQDAEGAAGKARDVALANEDRPGAGSQSRARRSPSVDLPLPVGPTTATVSPAPTVKLTPRSAGGRPAYANVRFSNRMAGAWGDEGSEDK